MSGPLGTRRVLITGGGSGIGAAVAAALAKEGGRVVVAGRRADRLEAVAAADPGRIFPLPCDLGAAAERETLLPRARELLGGLDGLVCSAGQAIHQPPGHIAEEALRVQLEINLVAPLRLGEQALQELEAGGAVVFLSSTLAHRPIETSAVYSASKAGLEAAMRSLALVGAARGIRFNAVCPGVVDTEMVRALRLAPGEEAPDPAERERRIETQLDELRALHPLGRLGTPGEVAGVVHHLLGASWITGTAQVIDGGQLLRG